MPRATWALGTATALGLALSGWLYLDNRALRAELARQPPAAAALPPPARGWDATVPAARTAALPRGKPAAAPALPDEPKETRMDRRARRTDELAQMFGRLDGESDADYKARVLPLITAGLAVPRLRADDQRKVAEDKAHVTPEQSARLDKAFDKVYSDVLDYTNKAVTDGELSPYERNVAGWLEYAGGLGGILNDANGQIGKILDPGQARTMYDAGFEWSEYLGVKAPWEQLRPPPPRGK